MIKLRLYFTIFVICLCIYMGRSKVAIKGVSHLCHNPDGRLGRCTSLTKCQRHVGCDRNASVWQCSNGHGHPPHVCCVFGQSIVFPDNDYVDDSNKRTLAANIRSRYVVPESRNRGILFPDENGNFNIPTEAPPPTNISQRVAQQWLSLKKKIDLFPRPPVCGPMSVVDKIHGGVEAELGEFPWLVNLEYRTEDDDLQIGCAGNILTHRYVLTAAHCVKGPIEQQLGKLESLRVGDHNTATARDCDDLGCIDPFERFGVVERMVHDNFLYTKKGRIFYDIALLKTDRSITYSYSVAPICLPTVMRHVEPPITGARLTVGGWGDNGTFEFTDEKRIVDVPYVDNGICPIRIDPNQICAGGEIGRDSCIGDSGGSLARRADRVWVIEGIVSYGRGCGLAKPAIYTRVRNFLQWIQDHIERSINIETYGESGS